MSFFCSHQKVELPYAQYKYGESKPYVPYITVSKLYKQSKITEDGMDTMPQPMGTGTHRIISVFANLAFRNVMLLQSAQKEEAICCKQSWFAKQECGKNW